MRVPTDFSQFDHVASPIFVLAVSPTGDPIYVAFNTHACAVARRPLSDFIGHTALEVYSEDFGRTAYDRHCAVIASKSPLTYELDLPLGQRTRTIRTTLTPQLDADGEVCLLYGSSTDVSAERDAVEAKVSFDTVTSEMEQFITMAAHDLRAPMRNVALLAEMLREDFVDHGDGKLQLLEMMEDVATKSMALIADVLAHARATAPKNQHTAFDFPALARDICDVLDPQGLHHFNVTAGQVTADRIALQIALRNIIDNAIKHGQRAHLAMDIAVCSGNDNMLDITLSDNGVGFTKSALAFLNGGTFRVDSGYGLLGVRRMIDARGGRITARNGADGGGIIQFSLPGIYSGSSGDTGDTVSRLETWGTAGRRLA